MTDTWEWSHVRYSENDTKLAHLTNYILGNRFPGINEDMAINFNLYRFLVEHLNEEPKNLAKRVTKHGLPIFSEKDMSDILKSIRSQKNYPYTKRLLKTQSGGVQESDPSRNKFWDKLFRKMTHGISSQIPPSWDGVFWYIHILYHLEQIDIIGPFLSTALDTITLSLPVMAEITSGATEKLLSLAPIPYAGVIGGTLGYGISLLFITLAVFLNNSRKHFGSSFKVALEAIPVVGDAASLAAQSVETGADRFLGYKQKMVKSVSKVSPTVGEVVYSYTPDVNIHTEKPPPLDGSTYDEVKRNIVEYGKKQSGLDKVMDSVPDLSNPSAIQGALLKDNKEKKGGRRTRKRK